MTACWHKRLWLAAAGGAARLALPRCAARRRRARSRSTRDYATAPRRAARPDAEAEAEAKSAGCSSCHTATDAPTMHDDRGGGARLRRLPRRRRRGRRRRRAWPRRSALCRAARPGARAAALSARPGTIPSSANPKRSYTLLNREAPEYHPLRQPVRLSRRARSLRRLPHRGDRGGRALADGDRRDVLGRRGLQQRHRARSRTTSSARPIPRDGEPAKIVSPGNPPGTVTPEQKARGALPALYPLPTWQVVPPGDIFRVFERGGRNISTQFPEIGLPNPTGEHPAARGAGPARHPPVEPRPRHRPARRDPGAQHPQDPAQRPLHVVHGHQRPAGRLSPVGLRRLPRRLRQRPRAARTA